MNTSTFHCLIRAFTAVSRCYPPPTMGARRPAQPARKRKKSASVDSLDPEAASVEKAPGRGKYDRTLAPDERVKEARRRIFGALTLVLATQGLAQSTVDDVCKAAGVSRRTFYDHFRDLGSALSELHDRLSRQSYQAVEGYVRAQAHPNDQLRAGVEGLLGLIARFPNESRVMFVIARGAGPELDQKREALRQRFADLMFEGVAKSHRAGVAARPPDRIRVYALVAGLEAVGMQYVERGEHERAMEALDALVDLVMRAFGSAGA